MTFIRLKKIKKKSGNSYEYAYLVENKWKKRAGGARQKVKAFLGRIYKPGLVNDMPFLNYIKISDIDEYVKKNGIRTIGKDLLNWELHKYDCEGFQVDFKKHTIRIGTKKVVLQINEGFVCDYTIKRLLNFRFSDDEYQAGITLAQVFVEAGIKIPHELFVKIFERLSS